MGTLDYLSLAALPVAWLLDILLGDPRWLPHPVRAIGALIRFLEKSLSRQQNARRAGRLLLVFVGLASATVVLLSGLIAQQIHPIVALAVQVYWFYAALATSCLAREAGRVYQKLGDLPAARLALAMLVSRNTAQMDSSTLARCTIETVAENYVDGVLSPLCWIGLGLIIEQVFHLPPILAAPLVWLYKAISTLDSMVGYKTPRYIDFGRASARADDGANFLPARLALFLIPAATLFCGPRVCAQQAWTIGWRDRRQHQSPNSAHPEAAFAGALGIGFGGPVDYHGQIEHKPFIGQPDIAVQASQLKLAIKLLYASSFLGLLLISGLHCAAALLS